ncbi:50S ribosomal protein L17 [Prolixibacter denitrificans]|uniref:Large ribosomal subunit protein bL17 n=2 Tax=Prolixibacter denitrificans TaxID=1541063 RepID=A0A2P8CJN6_9BACT|nr:large subunit ribosomal protein L17 [Prolixibacter denitrificans]
MRHNKGFNHLGRTSSHRKAMLSNMANSLILHKRISTTVAKAKSLRSFVEPIITKAKNDTTHNRRMAFRSLRSKTAVNELFREVIVKVGERPGGYTRILKTGNRLGDNAEMCIIELVDYNENMLAAKEEAPKKTRSRRGGSKKKSSEKPVAEKPAAKEETKAAPEADTKEEAVKADEVSEEKAADEPKAEDKSDAQSDENEEKAE